MNIQLSNLKPIIAAAEELKTATEPTVKIIDYLRYPTWLEARVKYSPGLISLIKTHVSKNVNGMWTYNDYFCETDDADRPICEWTSQVMYLHPFTNVHIEVDVDFIANSEAETISIIGPFSLAVRDLLRCAYPNSITAVFASFKNCQWEAVLMHPSLVYHFTPAELLKKITVESLEGE